MASSSRTKRVLIGIVVIPLATAVGLEIASRLIDRFRGKPWDSASGRAAIEEVCRKLSTSWAAPQGKDAQDPEAPPDDPVPTADPVIVQPYTGWEHPRTQNEIVADAGYYRGKAAQLNYDVCILGGSVAQTFANLGAKTLIESLHRDPRFRNRRVRIHNYALAGYKEPQQAMMLSYLFAMGHKPDAVINIDGFNEAALGWNNARLGANPLYPHVPHWASTGNNMRSDGSTVEFLYAVRTSQDRARSFGKRFLSSGLWRSCFLYHAGSIALERLRKQYIGAYGRLMDQIMNGPKDPGIKGPSFDPKDMAIGHTIAVCWMETSTSIHAMCSQRGIPYLHVLQPTLHDTGSKPLTQKEIDGSTLDPTWVEGVHYLYPSFRKLGPELSARGIHFFDASGIFRDHPEDVYFDPCHFAERGNEILGTSIGEELVKIDTR